MRTIVIFIIALLLSFSPASGQELTEVEKLKIERLNLLVEIGKLSDQVTALQAEVGKLLSELRPVRAEHLQRSIDESIAALQKELEDARPGYQWDPKTGTFTATPEPPVAVSPQLPPKPPESR